MRVYLKSTRVIRQALRQTGRQRRVGISHVGRRDNKYVINVTTNNGALAYGAGDTGAPGCCLLHWGWC